MSRPTLVVYGNCQASMLVFLLNQTPSFAERVHTVLAINHAPPGQAQAVAPPESQTATLLWEQYDERETIEAREAVRAEVPAGCPTIVYPPMNGLGLWPFAWVDPRNQPEPGFPWGRYPWGDRIGIEVAKLGLPADEVADAYLEMSTAKMPDLDELIRRDAVLGERRDAASHVKIHDFVASHFRSSYLFWTWGHTASALNVELTFRLLLASESVLGKVTPQIEGELRAAGERYPGIGNEQLPLHPEVVRRLGITFCDDDTRYAWFGQQWTFREYITRYITLDRSW